MDEGLFVIDTVVEPSVVAAETKVEGLSSTFVVPLVG